MPDTSKTDGYRKHPAFRRMPEAPSVGMDTRMIIARVVAHPDCTTATLRTIADAIEDEATVLRRGGLEHRPAGLAQIAAWLRAEAVSCA